MTDYVETFAVPGAGTIGIDDDNRVRFNGCLICTGVDRSDARKKAHAYLVSQLRAARAGWRERAATADRALTNLGDDPFNLGRFFTAPTRSGED